MFSSEKEGISKSWKKITNLLKIGLCLFKHDSHNNSQTICRVDAHIFNSSRENHILPFRIKDWQTGWLIWWNIKTIWRRRRFYSTRIFWSRPNNSYRACFYNGYLPYYFVTMELKQLQDLILPQLPTLSFCYNRIKTVTGFVSTMLLPDYFVTKEL